MARWVQKFGGSSVRDDAAMQQVATIVAAAVAAGHEVVVVVSAMQGETDRLVGLVEGIDPAAAAREWSAVVASGEQVSAGLVAISLAALGVSAKSFNGLQAGIHCVGTANRAVIQDIQTDRLESSLAAGQVPVVTGFQGMDLGGDIVTLGRGGSDITAVALAAALRADECQIYTDVDGVYTSDPRIVKSAKRLDSITYDEMLELSSLGAQVLHRQAVEFAHKYQVPLRVLSTFAPADGTLVRQPDAKCEPPWVSGIAFDRDQVKITLRELPNTAETAQKIVTLIQEVGIEVDMAIEHVLETKEHIDFSFTVHRENYLQTLSICDKLALDFAVSDVIADRSIAKLSLVGVGMKSHAGVAHKMLQVLGEEGIPIHLVTSSEVKISAAIDEKYMELGARTLHTAFLLDAE